MTESLLMIYSSNVVSLDQRFPTYGSQYNSERVVKTKSFTFEIFDKMFMNMLYNKPIGIRATTQHLLQTKTEEYFPKKSIQC